MATVAGKVPTRLNPVGKVTFPRLKSAVPKFLTVKVLLRVPPTVMLPKSIALTVPSTISVVPSKTWISGAGVTSLSVMVTEPVVVVPKTIPAEGLESLKVAVSVGSTSVLSLILTVNEPVVLPTGMVMLVGIVPVKSAAVAVPDKATFTV